MMKKSAAIAVIVILLFSSTARADDALRKLGRGIANVTTCFIEIPYQITKSTQEDGGTAGATVGVIKGLFCTVGRCLAGIYDVITFPIPVPKGYKPIIDPEFVAQEREDAYNAMD